jgi:hypothetical protein
MKLHYAKPMISRVELVTDQQVLTNCKNDGFPIGAHDEAASVNCYAPSLSLCRESGS